MWCCTHCTEIKICQKWFLKLHRQHWSSNIFCIEIIYRYMFNLWSAVYSYTYDLQSLVEWLFRSTWHTYKARCRSCLTVWPNKYLAIMFYEYFDPSKFNTFMCIQFNHLTASKMKLSAWLNCLVAKPTSIRKDLAHFGQNLIRTV